MCLTTEAFLLFLSLLPGDLVHHADDHVIIAATAGEAHRSRLEEEWCTMAPEFERRDRQSRRG